ncbi:DUF4905 domain-containing protein [Mucilaginibacter sp. UR6-11]|uniref:DUF4905 domain-containing protein n=1 Tax=Mucilaginibacter sp. UR6-11 TaxID=1435644 RepID=UPI001E5A19EA|nr:DUF4905 domain-containing protein [Mucilaginibacter sp. UR6-11]MCC8426169.1 DUF4905 domain-containing protein [Mucilaginibacter sp. UR6-11]
MTMLLPFINEQLSGVIWRVEIDGLTDTVFLEIRTTERQVSFNSINLVNGKTYLKDYTSPERWLTGIEAAYDGILLVHNYQSENTPVHKGVTAINSKGEVLWSNYTYAFDHLSINGPILFNIQLQPKKLFLTDIKTGVQLRAFEQTIDVEAPAYVVIPKISAPEDLNISLPVEVYGNIVHYLDYNNFRIVSLHSLEAGQLKQHLYITDGNGLVYEDLLNADIQKMQPESFILYKNSLIYIKNKSELKVLNL